MTVRSGEGLLPCTTNCGWSGISCGREAAPLLLLPTTTEAVSEAGIGLPCCDSSNFIWTTDDEVDATLDATPTISTGITT